MVLTTNLLANSSKWSKIYQSNLALDNVGSVDQVLTCSTSGTFKWTTPSSGITRATITQNDYATQSTGIRFVHNMINGSGGRTNAQINSSAFRIEEATNSNIHMYFRQSIYDTYSNEIWGGAPSNHILQLINNDNTNTYNSALMVGATTGAIIRSSFSNGVMALFAYSNQANY